MSIGGAGIEFENVSTSELRLKLTEVARRVERQKTRVVIRRRFDIVAFMVPMEDYRQAALPAHNEVVRSVREARDSIAAIIDRLIEGDASYIIEQRGQPVAALVPVGAMPSFAADIKANVDGHGNVIPMMTLNAATSPITSEKTERNSEIIIAAELEDQAGKHCLDDGVITLRTEGGRKFLSGVIKPNVPPDKLMIRVKGAFVSGFRPVSNRREYFEFGEVEVDTTAAPADVQLMRLA